MKQLILSLLLCCLSFSLEARVPDIPDYRDENGYIYKHFRDEVSGHMLPGHDGEVLFWGVDTRMPDAEAKWAKVTKIVVPTTMIAKTDDGTVVKKKVTAVDGHAFNHLPNLTTIVIPEGITYVNPFALGGTNAKIVSIPASWTSHIYEFHGYKCKWEQINVAKNHPTRSSIDGVMYDKAQTKLIVYPRCYKGVLKLPATLKTIGEKAFEDAENVGKIVLPNGVEVLETSAFYQSDIEEITLPSTLRRMGKNTLNYCKQLRVIRSKSTVPPVAEVDEDNIRLDMELWGLKLDSLTVYIPKGSLDKYKEALWWRKIKNYVEE